jgi:hypothetical protein
VLACALACAAAARAQALPEASARLDADRRWVNGVTESWWLADGFTDAEASAAAARWKAIGDELAGAKGAAWSGDYFRGGETHGTYMRWSPRAGFVIAHVDKCQAMVTGLVHGRVEATPGLVRFFPELDKHPARGHGHGGHGAPAHREPRDVLNFVPVEWRGGRMFVAEEEMPDFGDYVAGLGGYNQWVSFMFLDYTVFFSRMGEEAAGGPPSPAVPPAYRHFLKKPVEATVTSVGRRVLRRDYHVEGENTSMTFERASLTYVTIDAGAERGVKPGMILRVVRDGDEEDSLLVLRAGRRASTAAVVREVDERGAETYYSNAESRERRRSKVSAGWRLTTSLHD